MVRIVIDDKNTVDIPLVLIAPVNSLKLVQCSVYRCEIHLQPMRQRCSTGGVSNIVHTVDMQLDFAKLLPLVTERKTTAP